MTLAEKFNWLQAQTDFVVKSDLDEVSIYLPWGVHRGNTLEDALDAAVVGSRRVLSGSG